MLPIERHHLILDEAKGNRFVPLKKLQQLTGGSASTLRRDVVWLEKSGQIVRTSGGIMLRGADSFDRNSFLYAEREKVFHAQKESIGEATQKYIAEGDVIFLVEGTTTVEVARHLNPAKRFTVVTNGIDIMLSLQDKPNVQVIFLGGIVDFAHRVIIGPTVFDMLEKFFPTKIISGAGGITEERGVTIYDFAGLSFYKTIMEKVDEVIVVADHSKFGRNVLVQAVPLDRISKIVTDKEVDSRYIDMFKKFGIEYSLV